MRVSEWVSEWFLGREREAGGGGEEMMGMERDGSVDVDVGCIVNYLNWDGGLFLFSRCKLFMIYCVCGNEDGGFGAFCSLKLSIRGDELRKPDS